VEQQENVVELGFTFRLLDDFGKCCPHLYGPDDQFWRRTAFRSLFGFFEAWTSVMSNHLVPDALREHGDTLIKTDADRQYVYALLKATQPGEWTLTDQGEGKLRPRKLGFLPLLKATVRMSLFIRGVPKGEADKQFSHAIWGQISRAVKVRDRITHPHVHEDVYVSDDDVACLKAVSGWLSSFIATVKFPATPARYADDSENSEVD
jgi:hypothetical protein